MLKFSFNSTTLRYMGVFEALTQIQNCGYDGVELMLNDTHLHPLRTPMTRVTEIRDFCSDHGIEIVCVAAGGDQLLSEIPYHPSLIAREESGRRQRIDLLKRSMEIAEILNAPVLAFNSGLLTEDVSRSEASGYIRDGITELLKSKGDLILALEPEPNFFIGTTTDAIALIQELNSPRLRLNLDIGHVNCSEDDCYEAIERAMPYTRHIHIEDIKQRVHHHEIPGEGDIDFTRVFSILESAPYKHYVSVELHHHNEIWQRALKESLEYMQKLTKAVA
jgi:sugar phosphate isomerase/epimerase